MNWDIDTPEGMANSVAWTRANLARVREGGVWFVPRAASEYVVSHVNKTLTRRGMKPDTYINRVIEAMGWKVLE